MTGNAHEIPMHPSEEEISYFEPWRFWAAFFCCSLFYLFAQWYESTHEWTSILQDLKPDEMISSRNHIFTSILVTITVALMLFRYLWVTRDRNLAALSPRTELRRSFTHLIWFSIYVLSSYWTFSYFMEQEFALQKISFQDIGVTPSHVIRFYLYFPPCIVIGFASFIYAKTRLPYFAYGISFPYLIAVLIPFAMLYIINIYGYRYTDWPSGSRLGTPLNFGIILFSCSASSFFGVLLQILISIKKLIPDDLLPGNIVDYSDHYSFSRFSQHYSGAVSTEYLYNTFFLFACAPPIISIVLMYFSIYRLYLNGISEGLSIVYVIGFFIIVVSTDYMAFFLIKKGLLENNDTLGIFVYVITGLILYIELIIITIWIIYYLI